MTRPRLRVSFVSCDVPILSIQAEARVPDCVSDTYGRAYMLPVLPPPPPLVEVMVNDTETVNVLPPADVMLICAP